MTNYRGHSGGYQLFMDQAKLGRWLRRLRKEHGLTLVELAEASGVDHSHISRVERAKAGFSLESWTSVLGAMSEELVLTTEAELAALRIGAEGQQLTTDQAELVTKFAAVLPRFNPAILELFEREIARLVQDGHDS